MVNGGSYIIAVIQQTVQSGMKKILIICFTLTAIRCFSQSRKTENLIIVTLDGMRWQEVFGGIDSQIVVNKDFTRDSASMVAAFGASDRIQRRQKLFPFFWETISSQGQLYGDRLTGSEVNNANRYKFSYPGYNEIFTGYPDTGINSNDKVKNPNTSVLEFIQKQKGFQGRIAAFTTWDVFPYILNTWRNGIYVNADVDTLKFNNPALKLINDMQFLEAKPLDVRLDLLTYFAGREYLKTFKPRVLYIAFDETDDFAHAGAYDQYLKSAHAEDAMISDLWNTVQGMSEYRNKTTLIVTCDHGRGDKIKEQWKDHGENIEDAGQIWIAVIGPDTKAAGLVKTPSPLYQKQIAPTIAALLGFHFVPDKGSAEVISTIVSR
jgi:Type I phosphodiesterase / nucleotide pyrophosphatase